jgi:hypothetical protein
MRVPRDFNLRDPAEQRALCSETWCSRCERPDLGLNDPIEYEEGGRIFVEGACVACGERLFTELLEARAND